MAATTPEKLSEPVPLDQVPTQNSTFNFEESSMDKSRENVKSLVESNVSTPAQETISESAQSEKVQDSTFDSRDPFKNSLESKMAATTPEKKSEPVPSDQVATHNSTLNFEEGSLDKSQENVKNLVESNVSTPAQETISEPAQSE